MKSKGVISSHVRLNEVHGRHVYGISACDIIVHGKFLCGRFIARKLNLKLFGLNFQF